MSVVEFARRYRVFCPRCGHSHRVSADAKELRRIIDAPCQFCGKDGSDAVELL